MNDNPKPISDAELVGMMQRNQKVLRERIEQLEAELARLRAGQEPVAFTKPSVLKECNVRYSTSTSTTPQPSAGPDGLPLVLAGVLFDFAGFLTTRPQVIEVGATANASPMADLVKEFSEMRGLSLDDAAVLSWQELLTAAPSAPKADDPVKVPVEPTPEMAKVSTWGMNSFYSASKVWADMLTATPSAPATVQGDGWIPVSERLPESERTVLAFYLNSHGKGRRVRAEYIAAKTKSADDGWDSDEPADYDEQADEYFWPAGWYEVMDNWDGLTHIVIHEGEVTHWMPLPESPAIAAARQEGGKV